MVIFLVLRGDHHPKGAAEASVVGPLDPAGGGVLAGNDGPVAVVKTIIQILSAL